MGWLTTWAWVNCAITYSLDMLLCLVLWRRGVRMWPVYTLALLHLLTYPVAMFVAARYSPWVYAGVFCVLGTCEALVNAAAVVWLYLRTRNFYLVILATVASAAVVCFGLVTHHPHNFFGVYYVFARDLAFVRLIFLICLALYLWLTATSWQPALVRFFLGLTLVAFSEATVAESQLIAHLAGYSWASYTPSIVYWAAAGVWLTIRREPLQ